MAAGLLVVVLAMASTELWAKRLAGGGSVGKQSTNLSQRSAGGETPAAAPQAPAAGSGAGSTGMAPAPAAAAPSRPWGGVLGGMAAGLGLAWLASAFGFGAGFAPVLLLALMAVLLLSGVVLVLRRRAAGPAMQSASGQSQFDPVVPHGYSPKNVGNDASARPWESSFEVTVTGAALGRNPNGSLPAEFDVEGFLKTSRTHFVELQAAWDRADIPSLRAMMTDEMLAQIQHQLAEREQHARGQRNHTEVVMLEARLLGIEELDDLYMASVEFSGLIREDVSAGPNPFREVWNITRPSNGQAGWLVAGVQALQ